MTASTPTHFTLGFAFTADGSRVVLLEKQTPAWQKGKLNGVGGKVKPGETALNGMIREFEEETGVVTDRPQWLHFAELFGSAFKIDVYALFDDAVVAAVRTVEVHEVRVCSTDWNEIKDKAISNLRWLIAAAIDAGLHMIEGDRIRLIRAEYEN